MNGLPCRCNKCTRLPRHRHETPMTVTPEFLRANKDIRDMLWPFDFAVVDNREYGPVRFDTAPLEPFEIVAQRSSGCVYALTGPQQHVLLATTEGQAGIMAA